MALPALRADGTLPPGLHQITTLAELFASFPATTPQRQTLDAELLRFVDVARRFGLGAQVALDGSYTTSKPTPNDIDLALLSPGLDVQAVEQRLLMEGFDLITMFDLWIETDQAPYEGWVRFFSTDRNGDPRGVVLFTI